MDDLLQAFLYFGFARSYNRLVSRPAYKNRLRLSLNCFYKLDTILGVTLMYLILAYPRFATSFYYLNIGSYLILIFEVEFNHLLWKTPWNSTRCASEWNVEFYTQDYIACSYTDSSTHSYMVTYSTWDFYLCFKAIILRFVKFCS